MVPQRRTQDQLVLDPNIFITDLPVDPWTSKQWTNNFIQQGINRCLGYNPTDKKWVRLNVDTTGKLEVSGVTTVEANYVKWYDGTTWQSWEGEAGGAPWIGVRDREAVSYKLVDSYSVPAAGTITHTGIDCSGKQSMSFYVATTANSTVYLQFSEDNTNFYDLKSVADDTRTWSCNNEKIVVNGDIANRYVRIIVYNTGTAANTVTVELHLRV